MTLPDHFVGTLNQEAREILLEWYARPLDQNLGRIYCDWLEDHDENPETVKAFREGRLAWAVDREAVFYAVAAPHWTGKNIGVLYAPVHPPVFVAGVTLTDSPMRLGWNRYFAFGVEWSVLLRLYPEKGSKLLTSLDFLIDIENSPGITSFDKGLCYSNRIGGFYFGDLRTFSHLNCRGMFSQPYNKKLIKKMEATGARLPVDPSSTEIHRRLYLRQHFYKRRCTADGSIQFPEAE